MSDDILHTGRADIHHPKGPLTGGQAARSECAEGCAWASHMRGGQPLYVQICMLCERINWEDLAEQVARVRAAVAEEIAVALDNAVNGVYIGVDKAVEVAREHAATPSVRPDTDRTPDVGTPDPQRYWWQHDDCDSGPVAGAADWPGRPCTGCGMSLGGWTRGAPIAEEAP